MDPRIELINRMDGAVSAMDLVRAGATARLNWRLIDDEVLRFVQNRVAQFQQAQQAQPTPDRTAELRQKLANARSNWVVGQAAIAIGDSPSAYMTPDLPSAAAPAPSADPRFQAASAVQQMLARAVMLAGAPDPEIPAPFATRAFDVLRDRVPLQALVQMVLAAAPPQQRGVLQVAMGTPMVAQIFAQTARASAVWAVTLEQLAPLARDTIIDSPPAAPVMTEPTSPAIAFHTSLVDTLLAQAIAADASHAEALYLQAIDAAEKTPRVDDDIQVLQQIVRASGGHAPSEVIVRRMTALLATLIPTAADHDPVIAEILAFIMTSTSALRLSGVGGTLVEAARTVLTRDPGEAGAAELACRTAELYAQLGRYADAVALLAYTQGRMADPALVAKIVETRAHLEPPAPAASVPVGAGFVPDAVRTALGNSLLWEDLRGDFTAALRCAEGDDIATAYVLAASGQTAAVRRLVEPLIAAEDTPRDLKTAAWHAFRYAQRIGGQYLVGGAPYGDVYLSPLLPKLVTENPSPRDPIASADRDALVTFTSILSPRATISTAGARNDEVVQDLVKGLATQLDERATAQALSRSRSPAWLPLAAADLHRRDGDLVAARRFLDIARAAAVDDSHALGEIDLVEGHWAACALESPLTLGLALEGSANADSSIDDRVERRERTASDASAVIASTAAYDRAEAAFRGSRRGLAMVALARAGLAAMIGDHQRAIALAREAERGFSAVGDELGKRLARTHVAIGLTSIGGAVDREGIREIGRWCVGDGCFAFGIGCARLLSRCGRRELAREGGIERALALHQLAYDLLAETPCNMLAAQALVDRANALRMANDLDSVADALERASAQLERADLGTPAEIAPRRAWLVQEQWALENQRGSGDGLDRAIRRLPAVVAQLDEALAAAATPELLTAKLQLAQTARISPTVAALYRARDLEADPDGTVDQRSRAWQSTIDLARSLSTNDALLYEGLALAGRGDDAAGSAVFQRLFGAPGVEQTVPGADQLPFAMDMKIRRFALALACFLRVKDVARARAACDQLVALDPAWASRDIQPWNALANVAALHAAEGDLAAALEVYEQATASVESRRSLLTEDALKRGFVDTSPIHAMYVGAARACLDGDRPRAFSFIERGRARALLDLAADRRAAATPWRAYNARRDLLVTLLAIERGKYKSDPDRIAGLEHERDTLVKPAVPERGVLDPIHSLATLDTIAGQLPAGTVLVEYAIADDFLLAWAIARGGMVASHTTPIRTADLRRNAFAFRDACAKRSDTTEAGRALADVLLVPLATALREATHVVFVPSDALHVVPFQALPFGERQLLDAVAVSYAPSASLALELGRGAIAAGPLLAVGNPADMAYLDNSGQERDLAQLPGAAVEVRRIVASYPNAQGLVGADASLIDVRVRLPNAKVLHFATHGIVSSLSPWLSTIALAHRESLDLATMQSLDLDFELITLSACNSGSGTIGKNDEVVGFARGLIAAGARRVVTSMWPVDDTATCELMSRFYLELAAGTPAAQALRTAQLGVRDLSEAEVRAVALEVKSEIARDVLGDAAPRPATYAQPQYWAPFMLIGM